MVTPFQSSKPKVLLDGMSMMTNAPKATTLTSKSKEGKQTAWENNNLAIIDELKSTNKLGIGTGRMTQERSFI